MADINATNLTPETLSTLDGTENIVAFDTAEGKKIPLSVLGDYVVQKLTQTLFGQTQSVANAIEQCNSLLGGQIVSSGFNFDTCTDVGNYSIPTTSLANSATGTKPVSVPIGYLKVLRSRDSSNVISQIFYEYSAVAVYYTRNYTVSNQTWTDWVKAPTRAEMDAVTNKIAGIYSFTRSGLAVTARSSQTYVMPATSDHILICAGPNVAVNAIWFITTQSNSVLNVCPIVEAEGLTLTPDETNHGRFTIANTHSATARVLDLCLSGGVITVYSGS